MLAPFPAGLWLMEMLCPKCNSNKNFINQQIKGNAKITTAVPFLPLAGTKKSVPVYETDCPFPFCMLYACFRRCALTKNFNQSFKS